MSKKPKGSKPQPKPRPGVQVVLRTPEATKTLLARMARECGTSMNAAACERLATGKWPQPKKGEEKP